MPNRAIAGAAAGLLAGVVFGIMMQMMKAPTPDGGQIPMMAMVAMVVRSESLVVGWIYHLVNSAIIGALFGWLLGARAEAGSGRGVAWGALWGLSWWVLGGLILMPLLLGMPAFAALRMPAMQPVAMGSLVGHLMYGGILGFAYARLRRPALGSAPMPGTVRARNLSSVLWIAAMSLPAASAAQGPLAQRGATEGVPRPAPAWDNRSWLNADTPVRLDHLRGRVVLLNFWVFTCGNCTRTVPSLVRLDSHYRPQGLTLIGIHTPEFPPYAGEHDRGNVAKALVRYDITYPNAQDNDRRTWDRYAIRYWPSFVLIDKRGRVRYEGAGEFHVGDRTYQVWEQRIQTLLTE
jgi:thiol-disulfide isomerase/thioredoxin